MQIAALNTPYLNESEVPAEIIEHEKEVIKFPSPFWTQIYSMIIAFSSRNVKINRSLLSFFTVC